MKSKLDLMKQRINKINSQKLTKIQPINDSIITCKIYLKDPFGPSFETLFKLCQLKNMKLLNGSTSGVPAVVNIDLNFLKNIIKLDIIKNKKYDAPKSMQGFASVIQVLEIK